MQIEDEVKKSFVIEMVKGSLFATVTDLRSSERFQFDTGAHMVHICSASLDNMDGEAAAFLGSRGGKSYGPIIVCGRFVAHLPSCYLDASHALVWSVFRLIFWFAAAEVNVISVCAV